MKYVGFGISLIALFTLPYGIFIFLFVITTLLLDNDFFTSFIASALILMSDVFLSGHVGILSLILITTLIVIVIVKNYLFKSLILLPIVYTLASAVLFILLRFFKSDGAVSFFVIPAFFAASLCVTSFLIWKEYGRI